MAEVADEYVYTLASFLGTSPEELMESIRRDDEQYAAQLKAVVTNYQALADFYINPELEPVGVRLVFEVDE
jgi:hypothetical protein